ncbi:3-oxoacyl-reductase [Xylariomycetidae sp. FL2044]|nr:3-oxoacyl-reductase [Xylariomycetidae sp. FL2044]
MAHLAADKMFFMDGRSAVITGGASGLGKNVARGFIANGASSVTLVDMSRPYLDEAVKELESLKKEVKSSCQITTVQADLGTEAGLQSAVGGVRKIHPKSLDTLVCAAGIRKMHTVPYTVGEPVSKLAASMQSLAYEDMSASFKVNVMGPYYMTAGLVDLLGEAARSGGQGRGNVILFSSAAAQHHGQFHAAYQCSKAAIEHMTRIMAAEFAEFYVRVNAIAPGLFPSRMNPKDPNDPNYNNMKYEKDMPARRAGTEEEMASTALYLASSAGAYMTGDIMRIDGGRVLVVSAKITSKL